jgi:type II secretory pathway pseudopilin PulG
MGFSDGIAQLKTTTMNRSGFTLLAALFMVMIIGIMLGLTGQSWKMIMKREREKELLFRGSQIKEAIENWNNVNYTPPGGQKRQRVHPLMDLKDLLSDPYTISPVRYLPQNYDTKLDDKNPKCDPDCAKLKIYQDPMTGKEWTIIRGNMGADGIAAASTSAQGAGIIGIASKSDEEPLKTDFKDTALENMGTNAAAITTTMTPGIIGSVNPPGGFGTTPPPTALGGKMKKYSEWKFIAEPPNKNDHSKIYRAYHEKW